MYARRLDPSVLAFSLLLYRRPFIYILFSSRFTCYNKNIGTLAPGLAPGLFSHVRFTLCFGTLASTVASPVAFTDSDSAMGYVSFSDRCRLNMRCLVHCDPNCKGDSFPTSLRFLFPPPDSFPTSYMYICIYYDREPGSLRGSSARLCMDNQCNSLPLMCVYYSNFNNPVTLPAYSAVARIQTEDNGQSPPRVRKSLARQNPKLVLCKSAVNEPVSQPICPHETQRKPRNMTADFIHYF